jgi:hypothetical protein
MNFEEFRFVFLGKGVQCHVRVINVPPKSFQGTVR